MTSFELSQIRLLVDDVASCREFYRDKLELPVVFETPVYVQLQSGPVSIGLYRRGEMASSVGDESLAAAGGDGAVIVLRVENVDAAVAQLGERGVEPIDLPTDQPTWGLRAVHFRDPAGNLVELIAAL